MQHEKEKCAKADKDIMKKGKKLNQNKISELRRGRKEETNTQQQQNRKV
jgi:hypothetical protein